MYDAVVVGGGPAGLSAASWLGRYRRTVVVLDRGEHRNRWTHAVHGYLGWESIAPTELLERARSSVLQYPNAEIRNDRATAVHVDQDGSFVVSTPAGTLHTRRLVLATGVADAFPEVNGFFEHYGTSVFHCPTCDGYEARGRNVVAFGWGEHVAGFALGLLEWAAKVSVVTDGRAFEGEEAHRRVLARHGIDVIQDEALELVGNRGDLRTVLLRSGRTIDCELAFFSIAHQPMTELAQQLGCELTGGGYVTTDWEGQTSVPGVYAAGDVTPGLQLVQVATAQGTAAGVACALSLQGEAGASASRSPAPDLEDELDAERP